MQIIMTYEASESVIRQCISSMAFAAGKVEDDGRDELEMATGLINAFVKDVTLTNLKLHTNGETEVLTGINDAVATVKFTFNLEE